MTIILLGLSTVSRADLVLDESIIVYRDPAQTKHDVTIYNSDEISNLYLEVTPYKVVNPGQDNEVLEPLTFDTAPEFLVSPNRAIVPPGSPSILRLLNLKPEGSEERIYRINLIPAIPPLELQQTEEEAVASMLQVIVAYQILVIILPNNPQALINTDRLGNTATFTNSGNANYLLTEGEQCDPADPSLCVALESKRIYPGNNWTLELPYNGPAHYTARTHEGSSAIVF
jgi:P pilus assembly chaperone PapD